MGSRGRSIRLRIYFLVAIPLITMLGLFGYVAYTSVSSWLNQDRAPSLIKATSEPLTNFVNLLQAERRAAVVYLSHPDATNLNAYQSAVMVTKNGAIQLAVALDSPGTRSSTTPAETAAITKMTAQLGTMGPLRASVTARKLAPLDALEAYTNVIASQGAVLIAEANSIQAAAPVIQGLGLISAVNTQEDMSEQDTVLAGALASGSLTGPGRVAFSQAAGRQQADTLNYQQLLTPAEVKVYTGTMDKLAPMSLQDNLTSVQQAVQAGVPLAVLEQQGLSAPAWQSMTRTWLGAASTAGTTTASVVLDANQQIAIDAKRRVWEVAVFGLAGLILTLLVSILLGRSINRRLTALRRSALTLAEEQLPSVVSRLRRGESVDVAAEAPPLRVGSDEIGQVGQAIDTVRQTAIRSAVDEARLRQGVNDMFRNLARRSQSLLQRQLTVLDGMERKATDPDVLEDLFKMDHLTTRMRRHAEGLIILSGAPPGRGWSAPVKLIDVMRGAISEVEDYARVTVSTQSRAALSGSAVTDVIHLLAELIENATTLSPPFTQVRVSGEAVASGFAIEIEDRGLGMTPQRMAELNERLAQPPEINPTNTEQLGLFVVGQLARRHGISVTLRQSPYGGTTAVALIPDRLIVDEGPAAITAGGPPVAAGVPTPNSGYGMNGAYPDNGAYAGSGAYASDGAYGPDGSYGSYGAYRSYGANGANGDIGAGTGAFQQPYGADGSGLPVPSFSPSGYPDGPPDLGNTMGDRGGYPGYGGYPEPAPPQAPAAPGAPGAWQGPGGPQRTGAWQGPGGPQGTGGWQGQGGVPGGGSDIRISGPMRLRNPMGGTGAAGATSAPGAGRGRHGSGEVPVVTGVPVTRPGAPEAPPFDVFTPLHRSEQGGAAARTGDAPHAQSFADPRTGTSDPQPSYGPGYGQPAAGQPAYGDESIQGDGNIHGDGPGVQQAVPGGSGDTDYKGLPRRVRQASLAPQLRSSTPAASTGTTGAGVPPAASASLSDMRNTLSAMQRGWQQGRSQGQQDTEGSADGA
jgi:signal transduction histidine kinase